MVQGDNYGEIMARDMVKKYAADKISQEKIYDRFSVKVRKESRLLKLMETAANEHGATKNAYVVDAVREKLQRDGYLPLPESPESKD